MANHGFSGGPVVILDPKSKSYHALGVLTGHAHANIRVTTALIPSDPHRLGVAPLLPGDRFWKTNSSVSFRRPVTECPLLAPSLPFSLRSTPRLASLPTALGAILRHHVWKQFLISCGVHPHFFPIPLVMVVHRFIELCNVIGVTLPDLVHEPVVELRRCLT